MSASSKVKITSILPCSLYLLNTFFTSVSTWHLYGLGNTYFFIHIHVWECGMAEVFHFCIFLFFARFSVSLNNCNYLITVFWTLFFFLIGDPANGVASQTAFQFPIFYSLIGFSKILLEHLTLFQKFGKFLNQKQMSVLLKRFVFLLADKTAKNVVVVCRKCIKVIKSTIIS